MPLYAHTKAGLEEPSWQSLEEHSKNVAALAARFADFYGAEAWGQAAGLVHDIGKSRPAFQRKLLDSSPAYEDHKGVGARLLKRLNSPFGQILAYCVAGHHGGLPDAVDYGNGKSLQLLCKGADDLPSGIENPLEKLRIPDFPFEPNSVFSCSFFTRMLFSALVDADYLDTERFMDEAKAAWRPEAFDFGQLSSSLDEYLSRFKPNSRINTLRSEILAHCRANAAMEPGLFSLTVPTGGGKTLTSMAFALDHAKRHGLRRVVYVIPYTSIIEQNAKVFRGIFSDGGVIEHHSTYKQDDADEGSYESPAAKRHRLACENWDAPVVVTTNVQFFESLFSNKPSKCLKLHNLSKSVIILDEAQMLPTEYLDPCLRAVEELATNYGSSVVLCTATQPALEKCDLVCGLDGVRELAPDPVRMHSAFARTRLEDCGEQSLPEVADMIREREKVLCIVNTRARASELFSMIQDEPGARHLSALMCPAHRTVALEAIRKDLAAGEPCRVVSTQLIEAGVDVSFPEVIREMAGLDSIIQAAGRCNREGERENLAPVHVFTPKEGVVRAFATKAGCTESVLRSDKGAEPFAPEAVREYFRQAYWLNSDRLDHKNIRKLLENPSGEWLFAEAAKRFRIIENKMIAVMIPYDEDADKLINQLRYAEHHGGILRSLQQYTVQVYDGQFRALDRAGAVEMVLGEYPVLRAMKYYDKRFGLTFPAGAPDASEFIL